MRYEYILVIVDNFNRFAQAYATRNKSARTVATKISNEFVFDLDYLHGSTSTKEENLRTL